MEKKVLFIGLILIAIGVGWFVFNESKPRPGQKFDDLGREHVPLTQPFEYNSNPPTSGSHFEDWVRAGVFDTVQLDRYLIHSLEHGYVIMSYNCSFGKDSVNEATSSAALKKLISEDASESAKLNSNFSSDECKSLVADLTSIYEGKGKRKLIVVPRPTLDAKIALTAWTYLDKFNDFDKDRIEKFIDGNRDKGPEKTME